MKVPIVLLTLNPGVADGDFALNRWNARRADEAG
jgi:hypothetical protein